MLVKVALKEGDKKLVVNAFIDSDPRSKLHKYKVNIRKKI